MKRTLVAVLLFCVIAARASADAGCGIVFGADWAFTFSTPARWISQCRPAEAAEVALALWPQGTARADAPAVMHVTVNEKRQSLALFAADAQQRLRSDNPNLTVRFEPGMSVSGGVAALVFRTTDRRNHELIAYVQGPTRFFIVAISAQSAQRLDEYKGAFQSLLNSFVPMKVTSPRAQ